MTVEISLSETEPTASSTDDDLTWICIFCVSGSNNSLNAAIAEFREATGR